MQSYPQLYTLVEKAIADLPVAGEPAELYEPVKYMLSLGGKRLRPILVLMSCDLFGGKTEEALPAALAVEVFHNFTLVHDDIMDKAPLRRGKPTVHHKWNETVAILSGDLMMIKATDLLCETTSGDLKSLIRHFNKTAAEVCEGQQLDMNYETMEEVSPEAYLHMISLKTAVLLGCSLKLGALIAGAPAEDGERIYEFGKNIGIAFQIQDDILDSFGEGDKVGKKIGGDIAANKKTLLLIDALKKADPQTRSELQKWMNTSGETNEKIDAVLGIYHKLGVKEAAENLKSEYLKRAFNHLGAIQLAEERKSILKQTAEELMQRMS